MIIFQNDSPESYSSFTNDSKDWIMSSSCDTRMRKFNVLTENEENIYLLDSSVFSAQDIYQELENVDTQDDILAFCNKYGLLIDVNNNPENPRFHHTYGVIKDESNNFKSLFNTILPIRCMAIEHFLYYKQVLLILDNSYNLLKSKKEPKECLSEWLALFNLLPAFVQNAVSMMLLEYSCWEEGSEIMFKSYPIYYFIYKLATDIFSPSTVSVDILNETDSFPTSYRLLSEFYSKNLETCDDYLKEKLTNAPTDFKCLARDLFNDIAEFHLKEIPLLILLSNNFADLKGYSFPSLADALIFQKYIDLSADHTVKKCANELCNRLFLPRQSRKQIYCCPECRKKAIDRKSARKRRANQKHPADR